MLPFHWITGCFVVAGGAAAFLPPDLRTWGWVALGSGYLAVAAWAAVSQTSTILGPCTTHGPDGDQIALTFDDGPSPATTPALLDLLRERGVKANFFCIGRHVEAHPEIVRRIHAEGHLVGNHSFRHTPWLTVTTTRRLGADLADCQRAIESTIGTRPRFFRPPYGIRTHATAAAAASNDLRVLGWSTGGADTVIRSVNIITNGILRNLRGGSIVLLHDHGPAPEQTLAITRHVLDDALARRLRPVRLDEMLAS